MTWCTFTRLGHCGNMRSVQLSAVFSVRGPSGTDGLLYLAVSIAILIVCVQIHFDYTIRGLASGLRRQCSWESRASILGVAICRASPGPCRVRIFGFLVPR